MTPGATRAGKPMRERDRYRRASIREQAAEGLTSLAQQPKLLLVLALLFGGWLVLQLTTPRAVRLEDLTVGTCLHVPTSSNDNLTVAGQVGSADEVAAVMARQGADLATCDASHSHEVAAVFADPEPSAAAYPGLAILAQRHGAGCEAAFSSYVGHPVAGSAFVLTVVVQTEAGWMAGRRTGACLVSNADGRFLSSRAGGSGR